MMPSELVLGQGVLHKTMSVCKTLRWALVRRAGVVRRVPGGRARRRALHRLLPGGDAGKRARAA